MSNNQKCSLVALVGTPNSGKSTLSNYMIDHKISIVSPKVQTTRTTIKAIFVEGNTQVILFDTAGIFIPKKDRPLERSIVKSAWQSIKEADQVCLLIDAKKGLSENSFGIVRDLNKHSIIPIAVINKIDLVKKSALLDITARLSEKGIEKIFMISALNGDGVKDLKHYLLSTAKVSTWIFNNDEISDAPNKFIASEITREKLFLSLGQDLPYSICVKNDSWQNLDNGDVKIYQTIYVLKESQKMIVVGNKGTIIKKIGQQAREEIARVLGIKKVHLFLFVKIKKDWMSDSSNYGY